MKGRGPEIDDEFPECYAQLMKQCWSANPDERPKAEELHKKITEFQIGYAGYDFVENNPIYKDIFTKAQVKRKKFLEAVYKIENNIDLIEDVKKDLDDRDDKYLNKHVDRYFSPPHPEAYTKSRLLSNLNDYRQSKVKKDKKEISEIERTLESLTVNNFNSGIIDISFDDE
ncbi:unnamed protein product [Rhizophagus irregularis]|uniref:Serine-threonine/tyrosine-protein kinase catalytic domain-containing protein n=1 Tax=Rhizophagus irregularis TaxID=588596 RepID=A0A915ZFE4_9GLOM|nr:unnamed protein product [Rhizophagus irregularis]